MEKLSRMNLIPLFTFYLMAIFVVSTFRRLRQYRDVVNLVRSMPGRWPRVLQQIRKHWVMFFTWSTFRPAILAIVLIIVQMVCSRVIWRGANITFRDLWAEWWMPTLVGLSALGMVALDMYFII